MTALLLASMALNALFVLGLVFQRIRHDQMAAQACETCPFAAGLTKTTRVALPTLDDTPTTMFR